MIIIINALYDSMNRHGSINLLFSLSRVMQANGPCSFEEKRQAGPAFLCDPRTHSFSSPSPAGSSINVQKRATKVLERLRRYFIQETLTATRFRHYIIPPRRLLAYDCVVAVGPLHFSIVIKKMATATHDVWGNKGRKTQMFRVVQQPAS